MAAGLKVLSKKIETFSACSAEELDNTDLLEQNQKLQDIVDQAFEENKKLKDALETSIEINEKLQQEVKKERACNEKLKQEALLTKKSLDNYATATQAIDNAKKIEWAVIGAVACAGLMIAAPVEVVAVVVVAVAIAAFNWLK